MISIIMPAYNAENTIKKAITSCLNQTYKDIEVIVINDASTDNTLNIITELADKDNRIKVFSNEVNKGAGLSRRVGVYNTKGEYITFLDSDDYYKEDCIETLFKAAKEKDADIVHPGIIIVNKDKCVEKIPNRIFAEGDIKFIPDKSDTKRFLSIMLIKKSLWDKVEYSSRRYIEDTPTLYKLIYFANNVYSINYAGYYYTQNDNSLIHSASKFKTDLYQCLSMKDILEFLEVNNPSKVNYELFIKAFERLQDGDYDSNEFYMYPSESVEVLSFLYKCLNC